MTAAALGMTIEQIGRMRFSEFTAWMRFFRRHGMPHEMESSILAAETTAAIHNGLMSSKDRSNWTAGDFLPRLRGKTREQRLAEAREDSYGAEVLQSVRRDRGVITKGK